MRRVLAIFIVTELLLADGCRGLPKQVAPSAQALPTAFERREGQLIVRSDFDVARVGRLVNQLTAERAEICRVLGLPPSDEPIVVYLFSDADRYRTYLERHFPNVPSRRAFFIESDIQLSVYAHASDRVAEDLRHEVAHGYLHSMVEGLPLWLDEGLAEYFEVPRGQNGLNPPHVELLADLAEHNNWRPDLRHLERLTDAAQMRQSDYAEAWAWVYLFLHSPPERREVLTKYIADLRETGTREPLSLRLVNDDTQPEQVLADYLATLRESTTVTK
jgi:hypothetical protein